MINPHGADALDARIVTNSDDRQALIAEAETLPSIVIDSLKGAFRLGSFA